MPAYNHDFSPEDLESTLMIAMALDQGHDYVFASDTYKDLPFTYSVGLTRRKLPELLVAGLDAEAAITLLTLISNKCLGKQPGNPPSVYQMRPIQHAVAQHLAPVANILTRGKFKLCQVVLHDEHGRFPWDPGCQVEFMVTQPNWWQLKA